MRNDGMEPSFDFDRDADRRRAVRSVQRWLKALSAYTLPIDPPQIDGIYGEDTARGVFIFQGTIGLRQTGSVDYPTWEALRAQAEKCERLARRSRPIYPFESAMRGGRVRPGERCPTVAFVQLMIAGISDRYEGLTEGKTTGILDAATSANLRVLQRVWQLPQSGMLDRETYDRLADAYTAAQLAE